MTLTFYLIRYTNLQVISIMLTGINYGPRVLDFAAGVVHDSQFLDPVIDPRYTQEPASVTGYHPR